jgi:hypothetical protein
MESDIKNIPYIVECTRCSKKKKVDRLLKMDADMYTNMGIDTTTSERKLIKGNSRKIYYAIKKIDTELGTKLIQAMDK